MKKIFCTILAGLMVFSVGCSAKGGASSQATSSASSQTITQQSSQATSTANTKVELTVSAAASLKDVMNEIKTAYIATNPNTTITYNFGSSGALQQQIEQGAPSDIFISAGQKQMKTLQDKNLMVSNSVKNLLGNKLVLVTPKNGNKITSFSDLTKSTVKKIAVGDTKSVPAGQYAQQVFDKMKLTSAIKSKLVYAQDVRQVLSWVETQNVQAGVVYETDAMTSSKVQISCVAPEDSHDKIIYPIGVVKASKHTSEAQQFANYLAGADAKKIFVKYGFSIPA